MSIDKILSLENDGLNMAIYDSCLWIRCKREMLKYNIGDMSLLSQNTIFNKDGKARGFTVDDNFIYLFDFCDYHILQKDNLQVIKTTRIGEDLSSDICGVRTNKQNAYISIRNGKIAVTNKNNIDVSFYDLCNSSFWDYILLKDFIYAGCVTGELIEVNINKMSVRRKNPIHKKNIYSVAVNNGVIYTVSQDMTIKATSIETFEILCAAKKAVKGMAKIIGFIKDDMVVADSNKISLWNKENLDFKRKIDFPTGVFNKGVLLYENTLYGSDNQGVYALKLDY